MGSNCEFGMAQRLCGAEPLDLLRWLGTSIDAAQRLLADDCARIADPAALSLEVSGGEYLLRNSHYRLTGHTHVGEADMTPERLIKRERTRLTRQAEMLMEELAEGRRILVRKDPPDADPRQIDRFVAAIAARGPCRILLVTRDHARAGDVDRVSDRVMRGYIDRFADPADIPGETRPAAWIELCGKAAALARAPGVAAAMAGPQIVLQAHVQETGDVIGASGLVGDPGGGKAIEGFLLSVGSMRADRGLTCTVYDADGAVLRQSPGGYYCGTRGACTPIHGLRVSRTGNAAAIPAILYQAFFADGGRCGPVRLGEICASATRAPVVAIRVGLAG